MSAGSISLESAIRTCKVDTAYANKVESDRFLNPNNMVCPVWNNTDLTGRTVCPDSFMTKRAGCNSATDRVNVENHLRPQYMSYVTLDVNGVNGNIYGDSNTKDRMEHNQMTRQISGNFGGSVSGSTTASCGAHPYHVAMANNAQAMRNTISTNGARCGM